MPKTKNDSNNKKFRHRLTQTKNQYAVNYIVGGDRTLGGHHFKVNGLLLPESIQLYS